MFTWRVCGGGVTWQLDVYLESVWGCCNMAVRLDVYLGSVWGWCNMAVRCLLGECVGVV